MRRYAIGIRLLAPPKWWFHMTYALARDHFPKDGFNILIPEAVLDEQRHLILSWSKDDLAAAQITHIQTPTLVLNGGADAIIPPGNSEILRTRFLIQLYCAGRKVGTR